MSIAAQVCDQDRRVEQHRLQTLVGEALVGAAAADLGLPLRPIRSVRQDAGGGEDPGPGFGLGVACVEGRVQDLP